jgi:hypothetical protein
MSNRSPPQSCCWGGSNHTFKAGANGGSNRWSSRSGTNSTTFAFGPSFTQGPNPLAAVIKHGDTITAGPVFVREKRSSPERCSPTEPKVTGCDSGRTHDFGRVHVGKVQRIEGAGLNTLERFRPLPPGTHGGPSHRVEIACTMLLPDSDDAIRLVARQRAQQQRVHDGEERCVQTGAEADQPRRVTQAGPLRPVNRREPSAVSHRSATPDPYRHPIPRRLYRDPSAFRRYHCCPT